MSRRQYQQSTQFPPHCTLPRLNHHLVFAEVLIVSALHRTSRHNNWPARGRLANQLRHSARLRSTHVILQIPNRSHRRFPRPHPHQPPRILLALRQEQPHHPQHLPPNRAHPQSPRIAPIRNPSIHHRHRNPRAPALDQHPRPQFALHQHQHLRPQHLQIRPHRPRKIQWVKKNAPRSKPFPC